MSHSTPSSTVPGGSLVDSAEGEVPVLITQTRATPGREREPIRACRPSHPVGAITAKHIPSICTAFLGPYLHPAFVLSCLVLSCQFLVASKLVLLPMSTRGNGGPPHRPPLPYPCGLWLLCAVLCCVCWRSSSSPLPNLLLLLWPSHARSLQFSGLLGIPSFAYVPQPAQIRLDRIPT